MIKINNAEISEEEFSKIAKQQGFVKTLIKKRWRAKEKELYYALTSDGYVNSYTEGDDFSNTLYLIGNYFKTRREAYKHWGKQIARQKVLDRLRELEGDWEVNWDGLTSNYICYYDHPKKEIFLSAWHVHQRVPSEYYSTKEAWQQVLEEMPNDIKLMLGISDV